jgi:hypothetical protein
VPALDEILDASSRVAFNLELKRATDADYDGLRAGARGGKTRGLGRTLWSSFYDTGRAIALAPDARVGLLISALSIRIVERARELGTGDHPRQAL